MRLWSACNEWHSRGIYWFRVLGFGVLVKDLRHPCRQGLELFSERYGQRFAILWRGKYWRPLWPFWMTRLTLRRLQRWWWRRKHPAFFDLNDIPPWIKKEFSDRAWRQAREETFFYRLSRKENDDEPTVL